MEKNKGEILFRRIGTWREEKADGRRDSGMYLEAVEIPRNEARYMQASYAMLDEDVAKALRAGLKARLEVDPGDLLERIN